MASLSGSRCLHHPPREAAARCPECQHFFCRECVIEHHERLLCSSCLKKITVVAKRPTRHWFNLWPLFQGLAGFLLTFLLFYSIGRSLIALPGTLQHFPAAHLFTEPSEPDSP